MVAIPVALGVAICGVPVVAQAAPSETPSTAALEAAIAPLSVEGPLPDADRAILTTKLVDGLRRGDFAVTLPEDVASGSTDASACNDAACWKAVAQEHGASHVVRTKIQVIERDYSIEVELFDGSSGQSIARSSESCEICGISDAGELLETAAATLRTKLDALAQGPATLDVVSSPNGALVTLDGEVLGTTPLQKTVVSGKHVLRITHEGFIAVEREITFVDGVAESLSFELEKVPSRLPPRPWGWVSLSIGLASVGAAVAFAAIRDQPYKIGGACSGDRIDDDGDCSDLWNTEWHVLGFGLAGAALTTLGVAILVNSGRRTRNSSAKPTARSAPRARVQVGPTHVGFEARF